MKVLIDIGHPAHVHLFRNFASEMTHKGHEILFTCREKEFEVALLNHFNLPFISFGKKPGTIFGKLFGLLRFEKKMFFVARKFRPDLFLSHGSYYAAHAAFLTRKPHIAFEDTFNFEQVWLYKPFTQVILTADYDHPLKSKKVLRYSGYHELAYLHPSRFNPDKSILKELGVRENEKYVIMRFVAWKASHDIGHNGISPENKTLAVKEFSKHSKVFISSESFLPPELDRYRINIEPHRMHDAMAFSSLIFGESATMVAEGATMGVPGIYIDKTGRNYTRDMEYNYSMVFNFSGSAEDQLKAIDKGVELLNIRNLKTEWTKRRNTMLADKIDLTAFLVWFVESFPDSARILKEQPEYQLSFK